MPKKKHIKLKDIKVKSFITSEHAQMVMAGESQETNCDEMNCDDYSIPCSLNVTCAQSCDPTCPFTCVQTCYGTCQSCIPCPTDPYLTATDAYNQCDC
jgi:hypothetical protein